MSKAEDSFRAGRLAASLDELQAEVRQKPADAKLRIFLAQLLMMVGQWDRAVTQLKVIGDMDASALPMARAYRAAIDCELLRALVFAGKRSPLLFGDPEPWIANLLKALTLDGEGRKADAATLRAEAMEAAPTSAGQLNGTAFEWIADGDSRLGPMFEVLLNGAYYWVPAHRINRITFEAPSDARDLIWMPAQFVWANEGEAVGFIPTRYPGSELSADDLVRLSRKTEWTELAENSFAGLGQRLLATDAAEYPLLEVREITFDARA
ncbi:MAG TPA: type VI secretion system accessory protein TagJ [Steroidobacteraceae bacterium]|nr:type VI secretion system accessory protein TagJ [Steroidobacteraceae bacterium]